MSSGERDVTQTEKAHSLFRSPVLLPILILCVLVLLFPAVFYLIDPRLAWIWFGLVGWAMAFGAVVWWIDKKIR